MALRIMALACVVSLFTACPSAFEVGHPPCIDDPDCHPNNLGDDFLGYRCRQGRCVVRHCGDGRHEPERGEECDDGNEHDWDGCDHFCQLAAPRPAPDAGPLEAGPMGDAAASDVGFEAGPVDATVGSDAGFSVRPEAQCQEPISIEGALRVGTAPGYPYQALPDIDLAPATVTHGMAHRLAAGEEAHGCVGMVQLRIELAAQCNLVAFFRADDQGRLGLQTASLTASADCPSWPNGLSGTWRLRPQESQAWLQVARSVPGNSGGATCYGPEAFVVAGAARLGALGQPDLVVDFASVRVAGFFKSSGQGGDPPLACVPQCGDGVVQEPEQCDDGNGMEGDGCRSDCRLECYAREGISALPPLDFSGDFTVEAWVHSEGQARVLAAHGLTVDVGSQARVLWGTDELTADVGTIPEGWNHWAVTYRRDINRRRLFMNGTALQEDFPTQTFFPSTDPQPSVLATVGGMRVSTVERYEGAFVPVFPFASDANTSLNYDFRNGAGPMVDRGPSKRHAGVGSVVVSCPTGPVCGDGELQRGEICDDGNLLPGDGCNGVCRVEAVSYTHLTLPTNREV